LVMGAARREVSIRRAPQEGAIEEGAGRVA
jgi:hypothetical protein